MGVEASATSDRRSILSGTAQNVLGIAIAGLATFGVNVLISRTLGSDGLGVVTVVTQAAFVLSFATRAGMDMAVLRDVAIEVGVERPERIRRPVARAVAIAFGVSALVAVALFASAGSLATALSVESDTTERVIRAAAVGLPFIAVANVWLAATRGLKIMRYTLYVFWAGQPVLWIVLMLAGWVWSETDWMSVAAYSASWAVAAAAAHQFWRRESASWAVERLEPGWIGRLVRYAGPRAPAALFAQLLFWTDLFVLTRYAPASEVGVYSAVLRTGQIIVLFLTSVNLMFSPYVADLHNRGERERLDDLFKSLTRWTLAATLPIFLLLMVAPQSVLRVFGGGFADGDAALRIVLLGQLLNIATGSVGFILIMVGRTGWDLVVYAGSLVVDLVVAFVLAPKLGMEGAAIANAVTFGVSNAVRLLLVMRFVRIQPYDRNYVRLLVPALVGLGAMLVLHQVYDDRWLADLLLTGVVGGGAYVAAYLWLGTAPGERQGLARLIAARGRR
jgi:O-antigen/teichoic acid export membrane protein